MILQIRTLHVLCFLVVDCGHIDLGFYVSETTLTYNMTFSGILMHLSLKIYHQHVRNTVPDVCSSLGRSRGNERAIMVRKIILKCPLSNISIIKQ